MSESNKRKSEALGMPFGTANGQLRKKLLFHLAGKCGMLGCFRCGKLIEDIDQFSIEHKDAWFNQIDKAAAFFDVDNIAFSHISCNIAAASKPTKKYPDAVTQKREGFKRYYGRNSESFLAKKRERYYRDKKLS